MWRIIICQEPSVVNHLPPCALSSDYSSQSHRCPVFVSSNSLCGFHLKTAFLTLLTHYRSGIGLETTILFSREGANVLMLDISESALKIALDKVTTHGFFLEPPCVCPLYLGY